MTERTTAKALADLLRLARTGGTLSGSALVDLVEDLARARCAERDARLEVERLRVRNLPEEERAEREALALEVATLRKKAREPHTTLVGGHHVPLRFWEVDLARMSDAAMARTLRALVACCGQITSSFTLSNGYPGGDKRASLGLMVALPEGHLAAFRAQAQPWKVRPPARIQVGMQSHRCGECDERCPPGHHGGSEWRGVDAENGVRP